MAATDLYCVFCDGEVTNGSHCVPCWEYKGVVTLAEYVEINGHYPKMKLGVKCAMKALLIDISEGMELAGRNLVDAAQAGDPELMQAVMVNVLSALPSYLAALRGE